MNHSDDPDWLTFWNHEFVLRRHLPFARVDRGLWREWRALCDPQAYAKCLIDITIACRKASRDFQRVQLISQTREDHPDLAWQQRDINALWESNKLEINLLQALRRFTEEQKRIRADGVSSADKTSRDWTKRMVAESQSRRDEIKAMWLQARESVHAARAEAQDQDQDQAPAQGQNQVQRSTRNSAGHETSAVQPASAQAEAAAATEQAVEPDQEGHELPQPQLSCGRSRKRSHEPQDGPNDNDVQGSTKSPRRSNDRPETVIALEERSSDDVALADMAAAETEDDPADEFENPWKTFLEGRSNQDRPAWEKLYHRAQKLFRDSKQAEFPEGTSDQYREKLRITLNKALVEAIGWDWKEHVDRIRTNKDGLYHDGELRQAELARNMLMERARGGLSPEWPPAPRMAGMAAPVAEKRDEEDGGDEPQSETNEQIAAGIARGLHLDDERQVRGRWSYLTNIGVGGQGEADLWVSARSDEHGRIADVRMRFYSWDNLRDADSLGVLRIWVVMLTMKMKIMLTNVAADCSENHLSPGQLGDGIAVDPEQLHR